MCAGSPPISLPAKRIEPAVGCRLPAIRLKAVLLPQPFGPIRPRISPSRTSKDTSLTARNPPKRLQSPSTASIGDYMSYLVQLHSSARVDGRLRQRQRRILRADHTRIDDRDVLAGILHDDRRRALVLARHLRAG